MGDLPGPEKAAPWGPQDSGDSSDRPMNPNEMMARFRALVKQTGVRSDATNVGPTNGRSGGYLRGRVRDRHRIAVMLQVCGLTNKEIAGQLGYTESRVSIILNSKKPELDKVRKEAIDRVAEHTVDLSSKIRLAAPEAFETMQTLLASDDEKIQFASAKDILDRAGYAPVKKQFNLDAQMPVEELAKTIDKINEANEVVMKRGDWQVHTIERQRSA